MRKFRLFTGLIFIARRPFDSSHLSNAVVQLRFNSGAGSMKMKTKIKIILSAFFVFLFAQQTFAAISLDNSATFISTCAPGSELIETSPLTCAYSVAGSDKVLYVNVGHFTQSAAISSITYNGVPLTKISENSLAEQYVDQWYLVNPSSGSNNLVITFSSTYIYGVFVESLNGVDQTAPILATSSRSQAVNDNTIVTLEATTTSGGWLVGSGYGGNGMPTAASSTIRATSTGVYGLLLDDNGTNTGWLNMTAHPHGGPSTDGMVGTSFNPAVPPFETPKEPVVIVPGIMGTRLNRVSDGVEVWPNGRQMLESLSDNYLDDLKLSSSGEQIPGKEMRASSIIEQESVSFLKFDFYKNLIDNLQADGYVSSTTLFTFPYDWRLDIGENLNNFNSKINEAISHSPNGKINIIAHSMGGLLVKDYLQSITDTSFVDKLILAGVPQLGAPLAFKLFNYGDNLGMGWSIFGLNPNKAKDISQNMLGVYELLPSREYVQQQIEGGYVFNQASGDIALNFEQTKQLMASSSRNITLLDAADNFHKSLDNVSVSVPGVYNLVGCQNSNTVKKFTIEDDGVVDIIRGNGDGTVPLESALNLSDAYNNYFLLNSENGVDHTGLINDYRSISLIDAIIQNETSTLNQLQLGISDSKQDCFVERSQFRNETTIQMIGISTHSPVALNAYDSAGRHTGPNAAGDIDLQIPGSSYETIGENSFIMLPASTTYNIVADGLSQGEFTLKLKSYNTVSNLLGATTYIQVPLESASTTATFMVSSSTMNPELSIDSDGDGAIDKTIESTAILSGSSAADITPPTITMPNIGNNVILNTPIIFSFSATDDLSGIATITAIIDGNPITNGDVISVLGIGEHNLRIKAVDNAGNPRIQTLLFNVVYNFGGFLPPIKSDGSGIYKQGSVLPVKFQLTDANNNLVSNATASLLLNDNDSGNQFRYDAENNQYIFNLDTSSLTSGTWQLRVQLDDGMMYNVNMSIR
ncbi:MAG: PxKF domain-containing protein [Patescibacteria group bacterium]